MSDILTETVDRLGSTGVGLLIFLENVVPPIPSEAILPFAGHLAAEGALNLATLWTAATIGAVAGAFVLYGFGRWFGYERLHKLAVKRWFILAKQRDLERGRNMFNRHGSKIVLSARCIPLLRSVISVPAGVAAMPVLRFGALTAVGSGIWNALFIGLGWTLGKRWASVEETVGPASYVVAVIVIAGVAVLAYRRLNGVGLDRPVHLEL